MSRGVFWMGRATQIRITSVSVVGASSCRGDVTIDVGVTALVDWYRNQTNQVVFRFQGGHHASLQMPRAS